MWAATWSDQLNIDGVKGLDGFEAKVADCLMQGGGGMVGDQDDTLGQVTAAAQQVAKKTRLTLQQFGPV